MNAYDQAPTTLGSSPRYIPGYLAFSSPKLPQPIDFESSWSRGGGSRQIRPLLPAHSENRPSRKTGNIATASHYPCNLDNDNEEDGVATLPLVEHANRAEIHRRQKRVESETSEALKGDIEWVRSGGILRDSNGRRDFARTKLIRDQLEEQEREKKALRAWTEYEDQWRASLVIGDGSRRKHPPSTSMDLEGRDRRDQGIGFKDVAWPVAESPESPDGLTVGAIREFVLAPLRGGNITPSKKKDRIRQLLLRYHPDKTAFLLSRVAEEEKGRVREGINNVFMSLKSLQGDPEFQDAK